jgi:hypothetical protein
MVHPGFRDAVHVPFIMVTCHTPLEPGTKVSLRDDNKCVAWTGDSEENEPMWHGVVDPFLESIVPSNTLVTIFIRKECFKSLRHVFEIEVHDRGGTATCHSVCDIF